MKYSWAVFAALMVLAGCQQGASPENGAVPLSKEPNPKDSSREAASERDPSGAPIGDDAYRAVVFLHSVKRSADGTTSEDLEGTGFVISPMGYVLTAGHAVFDDEPGYEVSTTAAFGVRSGNPYTVQLVNKFQRPDVAVLQLPDPMDRDLKWLKFGDSRRVKKGDALYALGFPSGLEHLSLAHGILSNPAGKNGNWQTTIPINPGQSGGPIFNSKGEVVAIAIAGDETKQLVTYAVPGAYTDYIRSIALATDARRAAESAVIAASTAEQAAMTAAGAAGMKWEPGKFFGRAIDSSDSAMDDAMDAAMDAAADANAGSADAAANIEQGGEG